MWYNKTIKEDTMYVIRVDFPDEDKYTFVTNDAGILNTYYKREIAEIASLTYENSFVVEVKDENLHWSV
jgi:hypothetical protein